MFDGGRGGRRAFPWPHLLAALVGLALLVRPSASATVTPPVQESEAALLLQFKAGITNFDAVQQDRGWVGWDCADNPQCMPVCAWGGVTCNSYHVHEGNFVNELHLGCDACGVKMRGQLRPGLQRLHHLEILHLYNNELNGMLPPEWGEPDGFRELLELNVNDNQLTGNMPDQWSVGPAFLSLADLQMAGNRFSGPFPSRFAVTNTSFVTLMSLSFANNQFTGPLPTYINGMITMAVVKLHNNAFTGPLPPDWGTQGFLYNSTINNTQALQYLSLHGNNLTGGLPDAWAQPGSFQTLEQLTLSANPRLGGTLPASWGNSTVALQALVDLNVSHSALTGTLPPWGAPGYPGMRKLATLTLDTNNLTGVVPDGWAALPALRRVTLTPGNPGICTIAPANATFKVCEDNDLLCLPITPDAEACAAVQPDSSSSSGGGSSFPVAAVAVPCVVVGAAALAGGFVFWRRRRGKSGEAALSKEGSAAPCYKDAESGLLYDANGMPLPSAANGPGGAQTGGMLVPQGSAGCFPCFRNHEVDPIAWDSAESAGLPGAPPRPSLDHPISDLSSASLPALPSGGGSGGASRAGSHPSVERVASSGPDDKPLWSAKERSVLELSDWEINPDEIKVLLRPDGSQWKLGAGGFGTVYKAMRNGVQPVAVKVLGSNPGGEAGRPMSDSEFVKEISLLRACRDTNILQFQGVCFKDGRAMLVTEYMEGGSLVQNIRAGKVSWWRRGRKIALDVARALVYLHSRRIIHLDIKSANVLLTKEGTAKVGDVGMAKIMAGDYVSSMMGTLAWSAPELLMGTRCTAKTDVYSMGIVLWEIVTGEMPVRGQLRDTRVPEECPEEVLALIYRCIDPDPAVRPTSTEVVELLLEAAAAPGGPPSAAPSDGHGSAMATPFAHASGAPSPVSSRAGSAAQDGGVAAVAQQLAAGSRQCSMPGPMSRSGSARPPRPGKVSRQTTLEDEIVAEAMADLRRGSAPAPSPGDGPNTLQRRMVLTSSGRLSPQPSGGMAGAHPEPERFARPLPPASPFARRHSLEAPGGGEQVQNAPLASPRPAIAASPFQHPPSGAPSIAAAPPPPQ